ncbi:unnamed protein product [Amoebophrya sp. A25]|nr:unnamed protein product [Amoebophrya sp. A25]|eukprot:GSA25T00005816001.1
MLPSIPPLILLIWTVRGRLITHDESTIVPWATCPEGTPPDECATGILDEGTPFSAGDSTWDPETALTQKTFGERRTGRSGVCLIAMGAYLVIISLRCFIPTTVSKFYADDAPQAEAAISLLTKSVAGMMGTRGANVRKVQKASEIDDKARRVGGNLYSEQADGDDDERNLPIFTPYIWKRSCTALMMFGNGLLMTMFIEFSFSEFFMKNVWLMQVIIYLVRLIEQTVYAQFMQEGLILVPINAVISTVSNLTTLAAEDLLQFMMAFFVSIALQAIDRLYMSSNQDFFYEQLVAGLARARAGYKWLTSGARHVDVDHVLDQLDVALSSDDEATNTNQNMDPSKAVSLNKSEAGAQPEDMIAFMTGYSTDLVSTFLLPLFIVLVWFMYEESQILARYNLRVDATWEYINFYAVVVFFNHAVDILCMNTLELFHGWRLCDYFEFCAYRFTSRPVRWKGLGETIDETVAPSLRTVDLACFSEQYYFMNFIATLGMLTYILGFQIILQNDWNAFSDPGSSLTLLLTLLFCKVFHKVISTIADYLEIWYVPHTDMELNLLRGYVDIRGLDEELRDQESDFNQNKKIIRPPAWSVLHDWKPPHASDVLGLDRYRTAFVQENQLWLQHVFADLLDEQTTLKYRRTLLKSFTKILGEIEPQYYSPFGVPPKMVHGEIVVPSLQQAQQSESGFEFDAPPPQEIVAQQVSRRKFNMTETIGQEILRQWLQRARFLAWLEDVSSHLTPHSYHKKDICELCKSDFDLSVVPVYNMTHLGSLYRLQRDHSPIFNVRMWTHFYKTFTPTCTVCQKCASYYRERNLDITVDERRFMRMAATEEMTSHAMLQKSANELSVVDGMTRKLVELWYEWARRLTIGEPAETFLPKWGFEAPKRMGHIDALAGADTKALLAAEKQSDDEEAGMNEEDRAAERERQRKKKLREEWSSSSDEEDEARRMPGEVMFPRVDVSAQVAAITRLWLDLARRNLRHPVLSDWIENVNESMPIEMARPAGFRQRSQYVAVSTILDRMQQGG